MKRVKAICKILLFILITSSINSCASKEKIKSSDVAPLEDYRSVCPIIIDYNHGYIDSVNQMCIEGIVYLDISVETTGNVGEVKVLKGLGDWADSVAIVFVKQIKWKPGEFCGVPHKMYITFPVRFSNKK